MNDLEVSQISISSKLSPQNLKQPEQFKYERSTETGQTSSRTFQSKSNISKTRINILNNQIAKIQKAQGQMESRFQKCIESLIKEIQYKEAMNNKLMKQVYDLKENIQDSKKDIQTIVVFVKKNISDKRQKKTKLMHSNSTKKLQHSGSIGNLKKSIQAKSSRNLFLRTPKNK